MRFGIAAVQSGALARPDVLVPIVQAAESLGYDSAWLGDHIGFAPSIGSVYPFGQWPTDPTRDYGEALGTAGFLLGKTTTLAVGVSTLIAPYRNPIVAGKTIASLDFLSGGRMRLALGVGWLAEEFELVGAPPYAERGKVLDEYVEILRRMWRDELPSFEGCYWSFPPTYFNPKPHAHRHLAILVGGHSKAALRRVARAADGWSAHRLSPAEMTTAVETIRRLAREADRDPAALEISVSNLLELHDRPLPESDRAPLAGTPDQLAASLRAYEEAGVTQLLVATRATDPDAYITLLERFQREVVPRLPLSS